MQVWRRIDYQQVLLLRDLLDEVVVSISGRVKYAGVAYCLK